MGTGIKRAAGKGERGRVASRPQRNDDGDGTWHWWVTECVAGAGATDRCVVMGPQRRNAATASSIPLPWFLACARLVLGNTKRLKRGDF